MSDETPTQRNPYPGLRPFEQEDKDVFFGRQSQVDELLRRLESRQGLSGLLWDTHRSYGARARTLSEELVHHSARGLEYAPMRRTSPDFVRFRDKSPTAEIEVVQ